MVLGAGQNIITRGVTKTGQTTSYQACDDGDHEAGWWIRRPSASNRTRLITRIIGGDDIILDRATGLMWADDGNAAGCNNGATINWTNGIAYANGLMFAGFSDWRMPNIKELVSIVNYGRGDPAIYIPPFSNTALWYYWSSTTAALGIVLAASVDFRGGAFTGQLKTELNYLRCVRKGV